MLKREHLAPHSNHTFSRLLPILISIQAEDERFIAFKPESQAKANRLCVRACFVSVISPISLYCSPAQQHQQRVLGINMQHVAYVLLRYRFHPA